MTVMDRMALVLAGTLLVCAASAAPERRSSPGSTACDLLRMPTTLSATAHRLGKPGPWSSGRETAVAVVVAREPSVSGSPRPRPTSTCTATGDGITVTLDVWHYASHRDAARGYQGWACVSERRGRTIVAPVDHGCVWGNQDRYQLGHQAIEVSFAEAEVLVGRTVLRAAVIRGGFGTNEPAFATEVVTVAAERLGRR